MLERTAGRQEVTRRGVLRALAGAAAAGLAGYAGWVEPAWRLRVRRWRVAWPGPRLTVAMLADPHVGPPWMPLSRLAGIVARTNALAPDMTVLLGDYPATQPFVTRRVTFAETAGVLAGLRAPLGVHAILGNHDWWKDERAQRRGHGPTLAHAAFADAGLPILENGVRRLEHAGTALWVAGLGDQLAFRRSPGMPAVADGIDDLPGTLAQITDDAPVILLAHEPDIFPRVPGRVGVTLAGHTHGGQVRLFGHAPVVPSVHGARYAYGVVREGGRTLVVSGGLGCSGLPVRFGMPPEITLVTLVPQGPGSSPAA